MPSDQFSFYIDFGATHTKALVQSESNPKTYSLSEPAPKLLKIGNQRNYNPKDYSSHAIKIFTDLVDLYGTPKNIAISGQMATYIIVNKKSEPLTPIISWQDNSSLSDKNLDGIDMYTHSKSIIKINEDGFRPGLPSVSLMTYLAKKKYALNQGCFYIPLTNFVLGSILERDLTKMNLHVSEAHCSGFFSLRERKWSMNGEQEEIFKDLILPEIEYNPSYIVDSKFGTRVFTPIGDQQAAIQGAQLGYDEIFVHIATGGQVVCKVNDISEATNSLFQIRPLIVDKEYFATITHLPAGRLFIKFFDHLTKETGRKFSWKEFEYTVSTRSSPTYHPGKIDVISINQNLSNFPHISEFSNSIEDYVFSFASEVVSVYAKAIARLPLKGAGKVRLSGGLLTKSHFLKQALFNTIVNDCINIPEDFDTSLMGLRDMLNLVDLETRSSG